MKRSLFFALSLLLSLPAAAQAGGAGVPARPAAAPSRPAVAPAPARPAATPAAPAASAMNTGPIITAGSVKDILSIAKGYGSATLEKDDDGDPKISGRVAGQEYWLYFYGCDKNHTNCTSVQFWTYWTGEVLTAEEMNAWNADTRFGKLYVDGDGDLNLEMDVNLDYGVTYKNLDDTFDIWQTVLEDVLDQME